VLTVDVFVCQHFTQSCKVWHAVAHWATGYLGFEDS